MNNETLAYFTEILDVLDSHAALMQFHTYWLAALTVSFWAVVLYLAYRAKRRIAYREYRVNKAGGIRGPNQ